MKIRKNLILIMIYFIDAIYITIQNAENGQFLTCDDSTIYFTGKVNNINQQ